MKAVPLYDALGEDYDRFVNWEARLSFELPFFRTLFCEHNVQRILDVACGTGQHAIAFAKAGYQVTAADISPAMIERAQANASRAGVHIEIIQRGFGELARSVQGSYDVVTCLGNSLPHLTDERTLLEALLDIREVLRPEGIVIIQNRNFDRVLERRERFMPPETYQEGDQEWIFWRFYDFRGELLRFNMLRLHRQGDGPWLPRIEATDLRAWRYAALRDALSTAGFEVLQTYGSYRRDVFDPASSTDLVLIARRTKHPSEALNSHPA